MRQAATIPKSQRDRVGSVGMLRRSDQQSAARRIIRGSASGGMGHDARVCNRDARHSAGSVPLTLNVEAAPESRHSQALTGRCVPALAAV